MIKIASCIVITVCALCISLPVRAEKNDIYPTAVMAFKEQGASVKGYGAKITAIISSFLLERPDLYMVDRSDIQSIFQEQELNLSGMVNQAQMINVGQLAGAKLIVTGTILQIDDTILLVGKVIGTETSHVYGAKVQGSVNDSLLPMAETLAAKVSSIITERAKSLVARERHPIERVSALNTKLGASRRPTVSVEIAEHHVGQAVIDPAAETEMELLLEQTGFTVIDNAEKGKMATVLIKGEGFSETAVRRGNLVCVKARVEIKAIDVISGTVIASDRQTTVEIDVAEKIAGKKALQKAAASIADRMFPKLVNR